MEHRDKENGNQDSVIELILLHQKTSAERSSRCARLPASPEQKQNRRINPSSSADEKGRKEKKSPSTPFIGSSGVREESESIGGHLADRGGRTVRVGVGRENTERIR